MDLPTLSGSLTRPLVQRRIARTEIKDQTDDLMSLLKAQIVQDGIRREEEHLRREEERKNREEERREERERRVDEAWRQDNMMNMMMMAMFKGANNNPGSQSEK